jgi:hypothetical protein
MLRLTLLAAVAPLLLSGCSWIMVTRAPARPIPDEPIDCTSVAEPPIADGTAAGIFGAIAAHALKSQPQTYGEAIAAPSIQLLGIVSGVVALVYFASLLSGAHNVSQCRAALQLNKACMDGDATACQTLTPGWRPRRWGLLPQMPEDRAPTAPSDAPSAN